MSFFIDKHGRRKSPIALAACGAALLDLAVYFCTAALLAGPLYRAVSFGGETITTPCTLWKAASILPPPSC